MTGTFSLGTPVTEIQGVTYRAGSFYLSGNQGGLYVVSPAGAVKQIYSDTLQCAHEGLDYSQGELRWLIDAGTGHKNIHFIKPN